MEIETWSERLGLTRSKVQADKPDAAANTLLNGDQG